MQGAERTEWLQKREPTNRRAAGTLLFLLKSRDDAGFTAGAETADAGAGAGAVTGAGAGAGANAGAGAGAGAKAGADAAAAAASLTTPTMAPGSMRKLTSWKSVRPEGSARVRPVASRTLPPSRRAGGGRTMAPAASSACERRRERASGRAGGELSMQDRTEVTAGFFLSGQSARLHAVSQFAITTSATTTLTEPQ